MGGNRLCLHPDFVNSYEERYSVNELEHLGVVCSIEYYKRYPYCKHFPVTTDHRALLSILKEIRSNKSNNSRLTRLIDRLLSFQFDIEHLPGVKMGLVSYISRHPNQKAKIVSAYNEEFVVAKLKLICATVNALNLKSTEPALHMNKLLKAHDNTHQIKPTIEATYNAINLTSAHATCVHTHGYYLSPAPGNQITNTCCIFNS